MQQTNALNGHRASIFHSSNRATAYTALLATLLASACGSHGTDADSEQASTALGGAASLSGAGAGQPLPGTQNPKNKPIVPTVPPDPNCRDVTYHDKDIHQSHPGDKYTWGGSDIRKNKFVADAPVDFRPNEHTLQAYLLPGAWFDDCVTMGSYTSACDRNQQPQFHGYVAYFGDPSRGEATPLAVGTGRNIEGVQENLYPPYSYVDFKLRWCPVKETCNGADDNGDGYVDNGSSCGRGVWRAVSPKTGEHFYTLVPTEATDNGYTLEGSGPYFFLLPSNTANNAALTPFYRFYRPKDGVHFYTTSPTCEQPGNKLTEECKPEGSMGYISRIFIPGTVPLYRARASAGADHFYTVSHAEYDNAKNFGYTQEGIAGFVWQTAP